jgi:two-component system response regulator PilR (NtrC family)
MADNMCIAANDLDIPSSTSTAPSDSADTDTAESTLSVRIESTTDLSLVEGDLEGYMESIERHILQQAMTQYRWNKTAAAKALGVSFRSLRYRLKKLGLDD